MIGYVTVKVEEEHVCGHVLCAHTALYNAADDSHSLLL